MQNRLKHREPAEHFLSSQTFKSQYKSVGTLEKCALILKSSSTVGLVMDFYGACFIINCN
ncbi:hypothetical protein FF021_21205 [Leptospira noguchii]|nr:hypothetical protein FF021_21205 [Leptospira noguchii]